MGSAKICKRNNIPRPGFGYWAKRQAGLKVKQIPVPKEDHAGIIDIRGHRSDDDAANQRSTSFKASKPLRRQLRSIVVTETLTDARLLLKQAAGVLGFCKSEEKIV